jgi:hypothetical protein
MTYGIGVNKESGDRACRIDVEAACTLAWACARARSVKRGDSAVMRAHKAVTHNVCVADNSRDRARRVDAKCEGALAGACARAGSIERREGTIASANVAVKNIS